MTQISSSLGGLNTKSSYLNTPKSALKNAKARADLIYENPNNFPKSSAGKSLSFQDNSPSFFKGKSIDDFLRTSAKKSKPLADLPYFSHHRRASEDDCLSENLDGLSHSDHNSSEMGRFQKATPEAKGKFTPGTFSVVKNTLEAKTTRYQQQQDLGSTAFKTPISKDYFQDSKQATARKLFAQASAKETISKSARKFSTEEIDDEINHRIEEETQDEEEFEQSESRNMRIALASSKKESVKRYNVFEDWRILDSVDHHIKENGTRGILSKQVWEKLIDPRTGTKVLSGTRSSESMRERYKRWLRRMTPEDREELFNFVKTHPKQSLENYNCMFDIAQNAGSEKKMTRPEMEVISGASPDENFLNSPPARIPKTHQAQHSERTKSSEVKTPRFDLEEDDIQNFEDLMPSQRYEDVSLQNSKTKVTKKPESIVKKNFTSKVTNFQVEDVSGKKRLLNVNLYEERFNDEETNDLHHTKKIKTDGLGKTTHHIVKTIQKATPKQVTIMEEEHPQKPQEKPLVDQELGSELQEMIQTRLPKKKEDMDLNIMIFVDDEKGERTFMQNPSRPRLVKIAKEYKMELKNLLEIFYSLSNDYDDLESLLKHGDDSYVWTPVDDKGLLENDPTAMHYLKLIKGEERINKRKMFLLREFN